MKKNRVFLGAFFLFFLIFALLSLLYLYTRKSMDFTFDAAYFWSEKQSEYYDWKYEELPSGYKYFLYLPPKYRDDKDNETEKIPLIVLFHGSDEKWASLHKYGRTFIDKDFQKKIHPNGSAVLVVISRVNYFTDPHGMSLLIQNIGIKNKCIDRSNIIGYGFSQGAKFVVELACFEPRLFRGVVSGSGFYQMKVRELLSLLPVQFYFATSENDKGIFEQGSPTGRMCGTWCRNSRYVQYKERWHFWVELKDKTGRGDETFMDWLCSVVNKK